MYEDFFFFFVTLFFIWKASGKTKKVKSEKKKKEKKVLLPYTGLELKTPSYENQFLFQTKRKFALNLVFFLGQQFCVLFTSNKSTHIFFSSLG